MDGILVVDKPEGATSFDVVKRVRWRLSRLLGEKKLKVGHTGTLDPFATGVLPVCVGRATRLARYLLEGDKHYRVVMRFGAQTDTDDREGAVIAEASWAGLGPSSARRAVEGLVGEHMQVPPRYSAIHVDGKRAYDLARAGVEFELEARPVTIHEAVVRRVELPEVEADLRCSKGTYIRAICRDLGAALGVYGHCQSLRRLESAGFTLEGAWGLEELVEADEAAVRARLMPMRAMLAHMPTRPLQPRQAEQARMGQRITLEHGLEAGAEVVLLLDEALVAIATVEPDGRLHGHHVF